MSKQQGRTVAVCESAAQVEALMDGEIWQEPINDWLALTPPVAHTLGQRNIEYLKVDDFFDAKALFAEADELLDRQVQWVTWLDDFLQSAIPVFKQADFPPATANFYAFKNFFDRFHLQRYGLEGFLANYRPGRVLMAPPLDEIPTKPLMDVRGYTGMILPALAPAYGAKVDVLSKLPSAWPACGERLTGWRAARRAIWHALQPLVRRVVAEKRTWQRAGWDYPRSLWRRVSASSDMLVMRPFYDVGHVLPELQRHGIRVAYVYPERFLARGTTVTTSVGEKLSRLWPEITRETAFWSVLEGWEAGRKIVEPWLHYWWHHTIAMTWRVLQAARISLAQGSHQALMTPNAHSPAEGAVVFAARSLGIPVITHIHGSLPGYCHQAVQVLWDMPRADYHFAYGPGVADYLNQVGKRYAPAVGAMVLAGGSARVDAMRAQASSLQVRLLRRWLTRNDSRPLILYIPTMFGAHRRLTGDAYACLPYYELQKQVLDVFAEHRHIRLVYKAFVEDWNDLIPRLIRQRLPDAVVVRQRIKLGWLMWAVDGIVLDFPATALGEVLLTNKPLLVFSDHRYTRFLSDALSKLKRRAIVTTTPESFLKSLWGFLVRGEFQELEAPDTEFRRRYITDLDDGRSAERVARSIMDIIAGEAAGSVGQLNEFREDCQGRLEVVRPPDIYDDSEVR